LSLNLLFPITGKKYDKVGLKPIQLSIGSGKFFISEFGRIFQTLSSTIPAINMFILIDPKENLQKQVRLYQSFCDLE
jgi:hypothetical protein